MNCSKKAREFVHSISNSTTVSEGIVLSVIESLKDCADKCQLDKEIEELKILHEYLQKNILFIKEFRSFLSLKEEDTQE